MGRKELQAVITLGGRVDNSFGTLGDSLSTLGYQIDQISQELIDFGEESLDLYASYDDDVRAITMKLDNATAADMAKLDEQMAKWAADTRYHATDVSGAVKEAATSGWELYEIYEGMPDVMNLAAGAEMDLVDAMGYYNSAMAGMNLEFGEGEELIDQWLKTASSTRATVEDLGESFETLGSLASFADSPEELFTMLGAMAEFGTKGSEAGTLLRNVMLRLIAPTDKATAALELLGATEEELAEIEAADLGAAAERMEELRLSAFDAEGNLLPMIDVVNMLREAVAGMTEKEMYDVLYDIFPTRTIRGIMDLLRFSEEEYTELMTTIADSDGYAAQVAQYQEAGLGGAMRRFESRWEELQRATGEALSDETEWVLDGLGEFVLNVASLDENKFDALVGAFTGIAAAGPALLIAGGAARLIGMMATPGGWIAAGVVGLSALTGYLVALNNASFEANFGHLELEMSELAPYLDNIGDDFREAYSEAEAFGDAVTTAAENYDAAAQTFATDLLTSTLTGKTLTEEEQKALFDLGDNMMTQIKTGITNGLGESTYWLEALFGGEDVAGVGDSMEDSMYRQMVFALDNYYSGLQEKAYNVGENLRNEMTLAFEDGVLDATEYKRIMDHYNKLNAIMSEVEDFERRAELEAERRKASAVTEGSFSGYMEDLESRKASELDAWWDEYYQQYGKQKTALDLGLEWAGIDPTTGQVVDKERNARVNAGLDPETGKAWTDAQRLEYVQNGWVNDKTGQVINASERDSLLDVFDAKWKEAADLLAGGYDEAAAIAVDSMLTQTDFGDAWNFLHQVLANSANMERDPGTGALTLQDIDWAALDKAGQLVSSEDIFNLWGASDKWRTMLEPHADNEQIAAWLENMDYLYTLGQEVQNYEWRKQGYEESGGLVDPFFEFSTQEELAIRQQLANERSRLEELRAEQAQIDADIAAAQDRLAGKNRPLLYDLTSGYAMDQMSLYGNVLGGNLTERKQQIDLDVTESETKIADLQEQLDGLEATVEVPDGAEDANGYITGFQGTLDANPGAWDVNVKFNTGGILGTAGKLVGAAFGGFFADGGRATEASIFGEVPGQAEWAIPEAHTQRTADLLDSAREASGFTWPELIERTGGLNANPHHTPMKVVYAPVIHAADARGVEQKLQEDKERFIKWMKEYETEKEMASYG